jgi:hypothetical protein
MLAGFCRSHFLQSVVDENVAGDAYFCRLPEARRKPFWVPRWPRVEYANRTARIITSDSRNTHEIDVMLVSISGLCQPVLHEREYQFL